MIRILLLFLVNVFFTQVPVDSEHPLLIAHAGGAFEQYTYTNSLEAITTNYAEGFKFFEIDLETTSDGAIVLLHDWDTAIENFYNTKPKVYSLKDFKKLHLENGLSQLDWETFAAWLADHPNVSVITDVKENNISMLEKISTTNPELVPRIIPQLYNFTEYEKIKKLGFEKSILTLYQSTATDSEIIEFVKTHDIWAVTMPTNRALTTSLPKKLQELGIHTYAHTVNTKEAQEELEEKGIFGVYTDFLNPEASY